MELDRVTNYISDNWKKSNSQKPLSYQIEIDKLTELLNGPVTNVSAEFKNNFNKTKPKTSIHIIGVLRFMNISHVKYKRLGIDLPIVRFNVPWSQQTPQQLVNSASI